MKKITKEKIGRAVAKILGDYGYARPPLIQEITDAVYGKIKAAGEDESKVEIKTHLSANLGRPGEVPIEYWIFAPDGDRLQCQTKIVITTEEAEALVIALKKSIKFSKRAPVISKLRKILYASIDRTNKKREKGIKNEKLSR